MSITSCMLAAPRFAILHLTLMLVVSANMAAAAVTWTGTGADTNWSTIANWVGAVPPANGDQVVFPVTPTNPTAYASNNNIPNLTGLILTITGTTSTYTISGLNAEVVTIDCTGNAIITMPMATPFTGTTTITVNSGDLDIRGIISSTANGSGGLSFGGSGTKQFSTGALNTFSGPTTVSMGILSHNRSSPVFGNSSLVTVNGALDISGATSSDASATETVGGLAGTGIVLLGSKILGCAVTSPVTTNTFSGVISGTGGFRKATSGTQRLTGNNTYIGNTTLAGGQLTVLGDQNGSNVIATSGTLKLANAAVVGDITTSGAIGTAVVIGNETSATNLAACRNMQLVSVTRLDVFTGTTSSQLTANGTVTLGNASLRLNTSAVAPTSGQRITIINNDGSDAVVGTFNGLPEGATVTAVNNSAHVFTISYSDGTGSNDVVLTEGAGSGTTAGTTTAGTTTAGTTTAGTTTAGTTTAGTTGTSTPPASGDNNKCGLGLGGAVLALALAFGFRRKV